MTCLHRYFCKSDISHTEFCRNDSPLSEHNRKALENKGLN